jgi:hypothetical protein
VWGRNLEITPLDSFLLEGRVPVTASDVIFGRVERVDKTAHDLVVPGFPSYTPFTVHEVVLGAIHRFAPIGLLQPGLGARGSLAFVPAELAPFYGGRVEPGAYVYVSAAIVGR